MIDNTEIADALLRARFDRRTTERPSEIISGFDLDDGYRVGALVSDRLHALGWAPCGRKLGFTNRATWQEFDLAEPIWAPIYDETIEHCGSSATQIEAAQFSAPRIEPEIVIGFDDDIDGLTQNPESVVRAISWVAPGFEIVECHYPNWVFNAADIVADFGAHGRLLIGEKFEVDRQADRLSEALEDVSVALICNGEVVDNGRGANALDGPVQAVAHLLEVLSKSTVRAPIRSGEMITTGTLTGIPYLAAGENWQARFSGILSSNIEVEIL